MLFGLCNHFSKILLATILILACSTCSGAATSIILPTPFPHPRLLMQNDDIGNIQRIISQDIKFAKVHKSIINYCQSILTQPLLKREIIGPRLLHISREALKRIFYLAYAYRMTYNEEYSTRAINEMINVCTFSDWNPSHYLDVAEMTMALAIGYDWLYKNMDVSTKLLITDAIAEKGLKPSYERKKNWFLKTSNNWNSVCNAGLVYGAIAIMDEQPILAYDVIERSIESNILALKEYYPDGGYPEGYNYWDYGTFFQVLLIDALESSFGDDFGLIDQPGFINTAYWMQFMTSPIDKCFNFSDSPQEVACSIPMWWFAYKLKDPSLVYLEKQLLSKEEIKYNSSRLLPVLPIFAARMNFNTVEIPKHNIWHSKGRTPVFIYREGWDKRNDSYLAVKGGSASTSHAHMDAGSFVYDHEGVRWAMDLGMQDYNSFKRFGLNLWDNKQNGDRWNIMRMHNMYHNTLTIDSLSHNVDAEADIIQTFNTPNQKGVLVDLTNTLGQVKKAHREVYIDSLNHLHVVDDISTASMGITLSWVMVTPSKPKILDSSHILLSHNGKKMMLSINAPITINCRIWNNTPVNIYDAPNEGNIRVGYTANIPKQSDIRVEVSLSVIQ